MNQRLAFFVLAVILAAVINAPSTAHFVWLKVTPHGDHAHAKLYFSEAGDTAGDKLPESIAAAKVIMRSPESDPDELTMKRIESDKGVALSGSFDATEDASICIETSCQYGLYHGSLLHYFAKSVYLSGDDATGVNSAKEHRLDMVPSIADGTLKIVVNWDAAPMQGAEVAVAGPELDDDFETDQDGSFEVANLKPGLYSLRTNHIDGGEIDGESYKTTNYYATLTVVVPESQAAVEPTVEVGASQQFSPLPEGLASFGAAVADGWLYVSLPAWTHSTHSIVR